MTFPLTGIVAAPFLPMLPDASIDWTTLPDYIGWIAAQRPTAIAMNMDATKGRRSITTSSSRSFACAVRRSATHVLSSRA